MPTITPTQTQLLAAKIEAIGQTSLAQTIEQSRAYYEGTQYPRYGNWPTANGEQHYPRIVTPLPQIIVNKSATFLMKQPPRYFVRGNQEATDFIRKAIDENEIEFYGCARRCGIESGLWFKFYQRADKSWAISLNGVEEIVPIYNPHDMTQLEMVRVQYKYQRQDGSWWWFREEWTDAEFISYHDLGGTLFEEQEANEAAHKGDLAEVDGHGPWKIKERVPNKWGVIPFQLVKNCVDPLNPNGEGDYWKLYHIFDRINVAYDSMDLSNQFAGGPFVIFKNVENAPTSINPHDVLNMNGISADAMLIEPSGQIRQHLEWYAKQLESMLYSAVGIVNPKLEDVAGLGQLSYAAMTLLHEPLMELTDRKRAYWSKWGLNKFFKKMLKAAGLGEVEVSCAWSDYFPLGGVDKQIELSNINTAVELGMPMQFVTPWLAKVVGVGEDEIDPFILQAAKEIEDRQQMRDALTTLAATAKPTEPGTGGNTKEKLPRQATDGGTKGAARKK